MESEAYKTNSPLVNSPIKTWLCLCSAAFAFTAWSGDAVTADKYPDADTVLVSDDVKAVYQADGTYVMDEVEVAKALTERGRRALSTFSLGYSLRYGKAEVLRVEIVGADGSAREIDLSNAIKDATDNSSMGANIYDPLDRTITCSVPGLKVGETRRVVTRRTTTAARVKDTWADIFLMQSSDPVLYSRVVVDGPVSRPLKSTAVRHPVGEMETSVVTNGDRIVYTWIARDVPQIFPEPAMPTAWTEMQNIRVSTSANWQELSKWYWDVSVPHLEKTNAAMTNKVEEIVASVGRKAPDRDLLKAVFKFVSQEIRYMGLTMEDTSPGYAPHDVDLTFGNRYGVCRDKAALLVAMLRIAGFDAYPVLIRASRSKMDEDVPCAFFNHAIAAVKEGDDFILMDPTDESSRDLLPSYQSDCSYLVAMPDGDRLRTSPVPPPEGNVVKVDGSGVLARDGSLLVEYSLAMRGMNDNLYRGHFLSLRPEDRRKFFEKVVAGVASGAELLKCEIRPADLQDTAKELAAELVVKFPEVVLRGSTRDELSVPSLSSALGFANMLLVGKTALEKRRYPLMLTSTASSDERLEIDLAGTLGETLALPGAESIEGKYSFGRSFERKGDSLVFTRRLSVGAVEFSPAEYLELREKIKRVEAAERGKPTFAKDRFSNANERIISRTLTYDLDGDSSWVSTNTVVKEVLTYKGKKSAADIQFGYNPSWKTVELVSAVVSNRNGSVSRVGEKEMNVMDADWVSSYPRYPAGKILVVNFPSVEVGSVITYTTVTKVKDAPIPFFCSFYFDSFAPVDFYSVRVGDWKREVANPRMLTSEPMLPPHALWRDQKTISRNSFAKAAEKYRAIVPDGLDPEEYVGTNTSIRAIRDWMAKHVRVGGPGFDDIRLEDHVVDPRTVLRERYATRLGYIRALCALLKGAGYGADIVFAGDDATVSARAAAETARHENVGAFTCSLCRVRVREGGFLWWGGETKTYYLGCENEYTPIEATAFAGSSFLDPSTGGFGVVATVDDSFREREDERLDFFVRENGSVDLDYRLETFGASAGASRKKYAEMLPEIRSRHFQSLLGGVSQAASATRDLVTDTEGYPFSLSFSAFVPDMAVLSGDAVTFEVPGLAVGLFSVTGTTRENPIGVGGMGRTKKSRYAIRFPEGYTEVEHLPAGFAVCNPNDPGEVWYSTSVESSVKDGAVVVEIEFDAYPHRGTELPADRFALLREWNRLAGSQANSTIVVRRPVAAR